MKDIASAVMLATARITSAWLSNPRARAAYVPALVGEVRRTLIECVTGRREPSPRATVSIEASIHRNYLVCLECGRHMTILRHHVKAHGLTLDEYRRKWRLPFSYPIVAPAYRELRSDLAKANGLGRGDHSRGRKREGRA